MGMKGGKHPFKKSTKALAKQIEKQHEDTEVEDSEEVEELEEEVHVCPLCTSQLDESIDEDRLLEHLDVIMGLVERLSHLQEGEEDVGAVIDQTISEILLQDEEVETLDEDEEVVEEE
jgi:DNA repair exonuclease SbcCD ATPase subunit